LNDVKRERALHLAVLTTFVLAVFGNSLLNGFVWDDRILLVGKRVYQVFDLRSIFLTPANGLEYLPVRDLSYAVDDAIWGDNPLGFHLTNLVLYWMNVVVLYFMTSRIGALLSGEDETAQTRKIAFLTALLFAVHPLHVEAVSFITGRNVLLSGLFFFGSTLFFARYLANGGARFYVASFLLFPLALFSKATAIILPAVLVLLILSCACRRLSAIFATAPFFALSAAGYFLFKSIGYQTGTVNDNLVRFGIASFSVKAAMALQIPLFYLRKLLVPIGLSTEYTERFAGSLSTPRTIASLLLLIAIAAAAVAARKSRPALLFSFGWFVIALGPVLNLFPTTPIVADRYSYLPSFGFSFAAAAILAGAHGKRAATALTRCACLLAVALSALSFARNSVWHDDTTLFTDAVRKSPSAVFSWINLGSDAVEEGDYDRAVRHFDIVKKLRHDSGYSDYARGRMYFARREYAQAAKLFEAALAPDPNAYETLLYLGLAYEKLNAPLQALECYKRIIPATESETVGGVREKTRERIQAIQAAHREETNARLRLVSAAPGDIAARIDLAVNLEKLGLFDEALGRYAELERMGMRNRELFNSMADLYMKRRDYRKAADYLEKSLSQDPADLDTAISLGVAYRNLHRYGDAVDLFKKAMAREPVYAYNLAVTYFILGERENALRYFDEARKASPLLADETADYLKEMERIY
jgi:protein O-mannosyl-transferase